MIINPISTCLGIVHGCAQSCAKKCQIPLDLFYLEVFALNVHLQVNSWTFVIDLLALDPPNDCESNEHLFGNCPWVCTELC